MVPKPLKCIRLQFYTALAAVLFASANPGALGLEIRTVHRYSGSPAGINPRVAEDILYLQSNRRRGEERRQQVNPLWSGGPQVTFYEPHTALIESCDGETKKAFVLNLDNSTYAPLEMSRKLTPDEIEAFKDRASQYKTPTRPTVRQETTTKDTGERKQVFGYAARHVITTFKLIPIEGTDVMAEESVTDGWYIDLDTRISCDPHREEPREGTTYRGAQAFLSSEPLMGTQAADRKAGPVSTSKPSLVQMTYIGKPETGFPILIRTTLRHTIPMQTGDARQQVDTMESEVTGLSSKPIDPSVFEVPKNFHGVTRILPVPRVAPWARWLAWGHYYWVRFRQGI